jgi:HD-GYP domain-containing protein (c-di-GMP phosphodiesterase class II)
MYIHDLNCKWLNHPFALKSFMVNDSPTLSKILAIGVEEVYIDSDQGADPDIVGNNTPENSLSEPSTFISNILPHLSPAEEFNRAISIYSNANKMMLDMMQDIRQGKKITLKKCEPFAHEIVDSMFRFPSALLPIAQLKKRDEYTCQHAVSVSALSVAFGRVLDLPLEVIKDIALGGLLHDVGKALVPKRILNKPEQLDGEEFHIMKGHVLHTSKLLRDVKGISDITYNAAAQHHERFDGKGYPFGLSSDEISLGGQVIAIADTYDAITSLRAYRKAMPPTEALKILFDLSGKNFKSSLVQGFIKGIGIYPAGSLVRLEAGSLGIVRKVAPDNVLKPIVQLIYDCKNKCPIPPQMVDLSTSTDKIISHESFEKWGIDQAKWATAPT